MSKMSVVKVVGSLEAYAPGFGRWLKNRGYTDLSVAQQLRLMAHVSRWLNQEGLEAAEFTFERADAFCTARRGEGYTSLRTPRALRPLQEFLQHQGVVPPPQVPQPVSAEERLLERYRSCLENERALVNNVVVKWVQVAALFLADHPGLAEGTAELGAAEVSAFCARELPPRAGSSARNLAAALRSFLRFLHVEGLITAPLAQAVPPVSGRKGAGLPRAVAPSTLSALLASCDRRTATGRRDYAVMVLLARLGLRAGGDRNGARGHRLGQWRSARPRQGRSQRATPLARRCRCCAGGLFEARPASHRDQSRVPSCHRPGCGAYPRWDYLGRLLGVRARRGPQGRSTPTPP